MSNTDRRKRPSTSTPSNDRRKTPRVSSGNSSVCTAFSDLANISSASATSSSSTVTISQEQFDTFVENQELLAKNQDELKKELMSRFEEVIAAQRKKYKIKPSKTVQAEVRSVYRELEKNDVYWKLGTFGFRAAENVDVNRRVMQGVKNILPNIEDDVINEAMKTYFNSKKKKEKRENRGTYEAHTLRQSRKQRLYSKLNRRKLELNQSRSITEEKKAVYSQILSVDYMSSELSGSEEEEEGLEDPRKCLLVLALPWRSREVNELFKKLDARHASTVKKKGMMERYRRKKGANSERDYPDDIPEFALTEFVSLGEVTDAEAQKT